MNIINSLLKTLKQGNIEKVLPILDQCQYFEQKRRKVMPLFLVPCPPFAEKSCN